MENDKNLAIEYILSNGTFPGWKDRLENWKKSWKLTEKDTVVYRGQGHGKESIAKLHNKPEELLSGIKSVISTSHVKEHVGKQFTNYFQKFPKLTKSRAKETRTLGKTKMTKVKSKIKPKTIIESNSSQACCLFEITVKPEIRYFDFNTIKGVSDKDVEQFLQLKKELDPNNKIPWPTIETNEEGIITKVTPPKTVIYNYLLKKKTEEQEILIDGQEGVFTSTGSYIDRLDGKPIKVYQVTYAPKSKGGFKTRRVRKQQMKCRNTRKY